MKSLWETLPKPFFALAPMEDVTDTVFRQIVASCARPDVFFTEFTNVDGMQSAGRGVVSHRLRFTETERPIVAQLWGIKPENYLKTAREIADMGFDGIDINMGCPQKKVVKNGGCAALINNPVLAEEIIHATIEGAAGLPVSVKTRLGYKTMVTEEWISRLLSFDLAAITIHARTAAEMSDVPAHWEEVGKAVRLRDAKKTSTLIIGNGDVHSIAEAREKCMTFGCDGVMIGRAVFENPWVFDRSDRPHIPDPKELLTLMRRHIELFTGTWGRKKPYAILRKFFKIYVKGFVDASQARERFMTTVSPADVYPMLDELLLML